MLFSFLSGAFLGEGPSACGPHTLVFKRAFPHNRASAGAAAGPRRLDRRVGAAPRWRDGDGNPDGSPVSRHAEQNLELLEELCFIPFERQQHLVDAMLDEIERLAIAAKARSVTCMCPECKPAEGVPPEPEPATRPS